MEKKATTKTTKREMKFSHENALFYAFARHTDQKKIEKKTTYNNGGALYLYCISLTKIFRSLRDHTP